MVAKETIDISDNEDIEEVADYTPSENTNCPEKIFIIVDTHSRTNDCYFSPTENLKTNLELVKRGVKMFVSIKNSLNPKHKFSVAIVQEQDFVTLQEWTSNVQLINDCLQDIQPATENTKDDFPFGKLFEFVQDDFKRTGSNSLFRVIFIYSRSPNKLTLEKKTKESFNALIIKPRFFIDTMCVLSNRNHLEQFQKTVQKLSGLDERHYVTAAWKNPSQLFEAMASLLAHPLQRGPQNTRSTSL